MKSLNTAEAVEFRFLLYINMLIFAHCSHDTRYSLQFK